MFIVSRYHPFLRMKKARTDQHYHFEVPSILARGYSKLVKFARRGMLDRCQKLKTKRGGKLDSKATAVTLHDLKDLPVEVLLHTNSRNQDETLQTAAVIS